MAVYKRMMVDSAASDIVYSNLFTGLRGNYLRGSLAATGLDLAIFRTGLSSARSRGLAMAALASLVIGREGGHPNHGAVPQHALTFTTAPRAG